MLIAILGRQSKLSLAELEAKLGPECIKSTTKEVAVLDLESVNHQHFGGVQKFAKLLTKLPNTDLNGAYKYLKEHIAEHLQYLPEGKLKLGISTYGFDFKQRQHLQNLLEIKKVIKGSGRSIRIIENKKSALSSAQVLYNKLTSELGWELLLIRDGKDVILAQTISEQDIDEYSRRDYDRPARDARVGMLPPKLAQIMINLASGSFDSGTVYDPFCGTGVVLQEAHLMGFDVAGSDLEPRMIEYTETNLKWIDESLEPKFLEVGDARSFHLTQKVDFIASEMFLGQPLNHEPKEAYLMTLLEESKQLLQKTLKNIAQQTQLGVSICMAIPAWKQPKGFVSVLDDKSVVDYLEKLGYTFVSFKHVSANDLLYARPDQIVGRKLLVLRRK